MHASIRASAVRSRAKVVECRKQRSDSSLETSRPVQSRMSAAHLSYLANYAPHRMIIISRHHRRRRRRCRQRDLRLRIIVRFVRTLDCIDSLLHAYFRY